MCCIGHHFIYFGMLDESMNGDCAKPSTSLTITPVCAIMALIINLNSSP